MNKFRKRPVVIEAVRYTPNSSEFHEEMPAWLAEAYDIETSEAGSVFNIRRSDGSNALRIVTLEGAMEANEGDWVIRGIQGELYPCKPDIFEQTYEPVS